MTKSRKTAPISKAEPGQFAEMASHLKTLASSPGWKLLAETMEANIAVLAEQIISKRDRDTGKVLTDEQVDDLRVRHGYLTELLTMPQTMAKSLVSDEEPPTDYDPFFKTVKEMKEAD